MGFNLKELELDPEKERKGVWVEYADDFRIKIARWNNPRFRACLDELTTGNLGFIRRSRRGRDYATDTIKKAMARHILLDWEGLEEENGSGGLVPVPYSEEKAFEILTRSEIFCDDVIDLSSRVELFKASAKEDAEKNSVSASPGSSDGEATRHD